MERNFVRRTVFKGLPLGTSPAPDPDSNDDILDFDLMHNGMMIWGSSEKEGMYFAFGRDMIKSTTRKHG